MYRRPTQSTKRTLFFCHTTSRHAWGWRVYKYALTVVDMASRYKEAEPMTLNDSAEVVKAFQSIYKGSPLTWPQLLQVDPGCEFMGSVTKEIENHRTAIRHGALKFTETKLSLKVSTAH